jgi:hypothetical protein
MDVTCPEYQDVPVSSSVDVDYFRRKAAAERRMAMQAKSPERVAVHKARAQQYQAMADRFGPRSTAC